MINNFETQYQNLLKKVMTEGELRQTRNARTRAIFGTNIVVDVPEGKLALGTIRKLFPKGMIGELVSFIQGADNVKTFEENGCPYWKKWADPETGKLVVDYGTSWIKFPKIDGTGFVNQLQNVIDTIKTNPTDRRLLIIGYNPGNQHLVSLPSCHYSYQFFVRDGKYIDMIWNQRSIDLGCGFFSDVVVAQLLTMLIAKDTGYKCGRITMNFGDTHIYEPHWEQMIELSNKPHFELPDVKIADSYTDIWNLKPSDIIIENYQHGDAIKLELLA